MSPLAVRIGAGVLAVLALIALRGKRWAYVAFVPLGLLYFPATQPHFRVHVPKCELLLPTMQVLVFSLHNYAYIGLFAAFCWMSWVQFRRSNLRGVWAVVATLLAGALVEIAEGMTKGGHCRVRDLVPAAAGALGAAVLLAIWSRLTRKPGYVRLVRPRPAAAPRSASPPPARPSQPRTAIPLIYSPPPPPADFSPGPGTVTERSQAAPTEAVAPQRAVAARAALLQRLQPILGLLRTFVQRVWTFIRRRRRALVVGVVLLVLVGAGAFVIFLLPAPAVVTEQPPAPLPEPPPPPRPLQAEVEGYYEPGYQFTVFDRRFTRVTLRPHASVTFARYGSQQDVECQDARIDRDAVHLRCTLEPFGVVTIDGTFPARYATSKLDMPVLAAWITVTTEGGETVYRAHDSFYWHVPEEGP